MPLKDAFPAAAKPALARKPNPAYTEVMIRVTGTITIGTTSLTFYIAEELLDQN